MESKRLNFIKTSGISDEILDIGYSAYFTNDYLETNRQHKAISNMMHVHSVIPFLDLPLGLLKKEDLIILRQNLSRSKKICFNKLIYDVWKEHLDITQIKPGIPEFNFNDSKDRKSIIVISESNKKQARSLCSQIREIAKDTGLLADLASLSIKNIMTMLGQYKIAIILDNSLYALLAMASGCSVISAIPFYDETVTYNNSDELNKAISETFNGFDIIKNKEISAKTIEEHNFEIFDKELNKLIIDLTKEPFIL
jgi:hypothetical protein